MVLYKRAKAQLDIKNGLVETLYYIINLNVHIYGVVSLLLLWFRTRKFYIRRNYNKVNSIETGRIVIAHLLP